MGTGCRKPGDCFTDNDCPSSAACIDNHCKNPCESPKACGENAECLPVNHDATCKCPLRTQGDPLVKCAAVECSDNNDCPTNKACINSVCVNPCTLPNVCGQKAQCISQNHVTVCSCEAGFTGDPHLGCIAVQYCAADNQCPSGTKCYNGVCTCKYNFNTFTQISLGLLKCLLNFSNLYNIKRMYRRSALYTRKMSTNMQIK